MPDPWDLHARRYADTPLTRAHVAAAYADLARALETAQIVTRTGFASGLPYVQAGIAPGWCDALLCDEAVGPAARNLALLADRTALGDAPEWRAIIGAPDWQAAERRTRALLERAVQRLVAHGLPIADLEAAPDA